QAFSELLERAQADRGELARAFEGGDPGGIAALVAWRSDAHHGGRAAAFATFESGLRVVYKPRSHDIDLAFAAFVREVAAQGAPALRLPAILARPGYGWSEHIASGDCDSPAAVDRYRERQGAIAAIVYFLCGM